MLMKNWLPKQLGRKKEKSPLWHGLAVAMSEIYISHLQPLVTRLASLNSYFAMDQDDLNTRISELGKFFYFTNNVNDEDLPLAVMQKMDEIHFKRTDLPIKNTISREFNGLSVEWAACYAPKIITPPDSKDYTKKLYNGSLVNALRTEYEIVAGGEDINNYFMTSRGVIQISITGLAKSGISQEELSNLIARLIKPIIPLEIVFDGEQFLIHYDILEPIEMFVFGKDKLTQTFKDSILDSKDFAFLTSKLLSQITLKNSINGKPENYIMPFDLIPLDRWLLDLH